MLNFYQTRRIAQMVKVFAAKNCLPSREENIIKHMLEGKTNAAIASSLNMSAESVKKAIQSIFMKTGYTNRVELAVAVMCEEGDYPTTL